MKFAIRVSRHPQRIKHYTVRSTKFVSPRSVERRHHSIERHLTAKNALFRGLQSLSEQKVLVLSERGLVVLWSVVLWSQFNGRVHFPKIAGVHPLSPVNLRRYSLSGKPLGTI
jgi:hypothetical protein